jgi:hypothetical protein
MFKTGYLKGLRALATFSVLTRFHQAAELGAAHKLREFRSTREMPMPQPHQAGSVPASLDRGSSVSARWPSTTCRDEPGVPRIAYCGNQTLKLAAILGDLEL